MTQTEREQMKEHFIEKITNDKWFIANPAQQKSILNNIDKIVDFYITNKRPMTMDELKGLGVFKEGYELKRSRGVGK